MIHKECIPAYAHGTITIWYEPSLVQPIWIAPYRDLFLGAASEGNVDAHVSFDGVTYYEYLVGLYVGQAVLKLEDVPAAWIKIFPAGDGPVPENTPVYWGAKA